MANNTAIVVIIIVAVLIVAILGFVWYTQTYTTTPTNQNQNQQTTSPVTTVPSVPSTPSEPSSSTETTPKTYNIEIKSFAFSPSSLTIKKGDMVIWTNEDSVAHTVTSDSGSELSSPLISRGNMYSHTFDTEGTYDYHCTPHSSMKGTIIVE